MLFALLAVVTIAPFEVALVTWPGVITLTSVELVALFALTWYGIDLARHGGRAVPAIPRRVLACGVAFLTSLGLAAATAAIEPGNAGRFVARMAMAGMLCVAAARTIDTTARARLFALATLSVASMVAAVAVLEAMQIDLVVNALTAFRPGFHVVAGQVRATSTLAYPTIASMYLEIAFVLGLYLLLSPRSRRPTLERALVFAALVVVGAGISATFTRAGLLAMAAALLVFGCLRLGRAPDRREDLHLLSALATSLVVVVLLAHSPELLAARLTTEGSEQWYGAKYEVPAALSMTTGAVHLVPIAITNTGRLTWDSQTELAFALSYHWLRGTDAAEVVEFEGQRTPFASPVRPGQRVQLDARVAAPGEPGTYTLAWDVVHESRAWLSTEGVAMERTSVAVSGEKREWTATRMEQLPTTPMRPTRPALWRAALHLVRANPLLGIGPDNYRLAYGPYLGLSRWDTRVHANNMYLEVLVGSGLAGLTSFIALLAALAVTFWQRVRRSASSTHAAAVAAVAFWVVVVGHGVVDSFLSFTTTYVIFAVTCGWALSDGLVEGARAAHRV